MTFAVKFFGSKDEKGQIRQIKMNVDAPTEAEVEEILRRKYGYRKINGLKIRR